MTERNGRCMIAQNRGVKTELLVLKSGEGKGEYWKWREWEGKDGKEKDGKGREGKERMGRKEVERKGGNVKGLEGRSGRKKEKENEWEEEQMG